MARWSSYCVTTCLAATLAVGGGCGDSVPPTPSQQGLKELRMGHYDAAIAICGEAVRLNPQDAEAYLYRGRAHHYRGAKDDLEQAIADFSESIRIAPKQAEAYYGRALAYRDSGEAEKSAADEKSARELDSQIREVYAELPDLTPPSAIGKSAPDEPAATSESYKGTSAPDEPATSEAEDLRRFMLLKERFEPGQSKADSQNKFLPLLSKPRFTPSKSDDDSTAGEDAPARRGLSPGQKGAPARARSGERLRGDANDPIAGSIEPAMPVSPFQRRGSSTLAPNVSRPIQSPFPQAPPRPTGIVQ
jgi:hypothetical protein